MRLLNTHTLKLKEFLSKTPGYYILSHTWSDDEPTCQEFLKASHDQSSQPWPDTIGFRKVVDFCRLVRSVGCDWAWVDTVCINKESSAELSEAINSMYRWYEDALHCCAFLSDVECIPDDDSMEPEFQTRPNGTTISLVEKAPSFNDSRWFRRGWTLQELLAPRHVTFFDCNWSLIGTKQELSSVISDITGIDNRVLRSSRPSILFPKYSIAARMSWASRRESTRIEDNAYCLLGIFGINMYLMYGEGHNAFTRLQKKLLRSTTDESIFMWSLPMLSEISHHGMFAPSPAAFDMISDIKLVSTTTSPISLSSRGMHFPVLNYAHTNENNSHIILPLNCEVMGHVVGVVLTKFLGKWYRRATDGSIVSVGRNIPWRTFYPPNRKSETEIVVETTIPEQLKYVRSPLLVSRPLACALRFLPHFVDAEMLLTSLDPLESHEIVRYALQVAEVEQKLRDNIPSTGMTNEWLREYLAISSSVDDVPIKSADGYLFVHNSTVDVDEEQMKEKGAFARHTLRMLAFIWEQEMKPRSAPPPQPAHTSTSTSTSDQSQANSIEPPQRAQTNQVRQETNRGAWRFPRMSRNAN